MNCGGDNLAASGEMPAFLPTLLPEFLTWGRAARFSGARTAGEFMIHGYSLITLIGVTFNCIAIVLAPTFSSSACSVRGCAWSPEN